MNCTHCYAASYGSTLCRTCTATNLDNLKNLTWLLDELTINLTRQNTTHEPGRKPKPSVDMPLIYDPDSAEIIDTITSDLQTWADHYATQLNMIGSLDPISWLTHHNHHISGNQPTAATYHQALHALVNTATTHIDNPEPPNDNAAERLNNALQKNPDTLLTKSQTSAALGMPRHTINNAIARGHLTLHEGRIRVSDALKLAK